MPHLKEIRPNLWIYELTAPPVAVRSVVVKGDKYAVVWDTLTLPEAAEPLARVIGDMPYYVVYSHGDWDHAWGTAGLGAERLGVVGHAECLRRFGDDAPRTLQRMRMEERGKWDSVRLVPPNIAFTSRLSLDLGALTLELHHTPGHTDDSIVGWIPEWGVLLGGDAIETPLPVVNNAQSLEAWLAALKSWQERENLEQAIASHGSMDGRESLDQTVDYLRALSSDRVFKLPRKLDDFYRETHQKNLIVVDGGLALNE